MRVILFIALLSCPLFAAAQNTFFRTFGTNYSEFGNNLIRTGNSFALTMSTPTNPPVNSRINMGLVKMNEIGEMEWSQEYIVDSSCYAQDLIQTPDGGYMMAGWVRDGSFNDGHEMMLVKTNNAGMYQWGYSYLSASSPSDRIVDIFPATGGGYIFSAVRFDNVALETALICKTDPNGSILWTRELSFGQGEVMVLGSSEMSNGDIIVCGTVGIASFLDIFLVRLSSGGSVEWGKRYSTTYDDVPTSCKVNALDEIYVCGYSYFLNNEHDMFIMKADSQGVLKNQLFYDAGTAYGEVIRDFDFAGGRLIVAGDLGGFDGRDGFMSLINVDGTIEWAKKYPFAPQFTNYPYEVVSIPGDGYALTGDFRTQFASREAVILKTDNEGDAGCYTQPINFTQVMEEFSEGPMFFGTDEPAVQRIQIFDVAGATDISEKQICEFIYPVTAFDTSGMQADCPQYCFNFHDTSKYGPVQWQWTFTGGTPSSSVSQHPQNICYSASGIYPVTLVVTNAYASDTLTEMLEVNLQCPVTVPDVFTPNGDGINDIFHLAGLPQEFRLTIYNRWGFKVFETSDATKMWNGKYNNEGTLVSEGVYFYVLSAESISEPQSGFLTVFF